MWIARNEDGCLFLYKNKPYRENNGKWKCVNGAYNQYENNLGEFIKLDPHLFYDVQWNNEPLEVEPCVCNGELPLG